MNKDNGGPAFPTTTLDPWGKPFTDGGLTLRDYFATKANDKDINDAMDKASVVLTRVQARYAHADEMLLERAK